MRKIKVLFIIFILLLTPAILTSAFLNTPNSTTYATTDDSSIQEELDQSINDQLGDLDLSELEEILQDSENASKLFGDMSFLDKLVSIINGDFEDDSSSVL